MTTARSEADARLILMCGRSFSGKSTICSRLAENLGVEVVSLDAINEARGLNGGTGIPLEEWMRTHEIASERVAAMLARAGTVIIDDTSSPRFLRDGWRETAAQSGAAFALVFVDTPVEVIVERQRANRSAVTRSEVSDDVMAEHLAAFEPPEADESHVRVGYPPESLEWVLGRVLEQLEVN